MVTYDEWTAYPPPPHPEPYPCHCPPLCPPLVDAWLDPRCAGQWIAPHAPPPAYWIAPDSPYHHPHCPPPSPPSPRGARDGAAAAAHAVPVARNAGGERAAAALARVRRHPRTTTLLDIEDAIPFVARADEAASRFVVGRLRAGGAAERAAALAAALASLDDLVCHPHGHYLVAGLFVCGAADQKRALLAAVRARDVVALSLHLHGCRVIQKAVLHVPLADVCRLFDRLRHKVRTFIHDVDGYHVISAYIKRMSAGAENAAEDDDPAVPAPSPLQSILDTLLSTLERTATNRCGCRVVQQVLERCPGTPRAAVLDAVTGGGRDRLARLIADPYGNYVVQAAWDVGGAATRDTVLDVLTADGALAALARHKYASAIVEAVLERGPGRHRARLLEKMLEDTSGESGGYCCLLELAQDPIANYVVSKAIEVSDGDQEDRILELLSASRQELSESVYAQYVMKNAQCAEKRCDGSATTETTCTLTTTMSD